MKTTPLQQLSVVIPMYNEADNVAPLLQEVQNALKNHPDYEVIVVNDGSSDNTQATLKSLQKEFPALRVLKHRRNLGQSVGVVTGVRAATKAWIVTMDGDGQNDPTDILKLAEEGAKALAADDVDTIKNKKIPLLIAGHRTDRKDSGWKRFGSRFANSIRRRFLKDNCPDTGCGLKLFPRETFLMIPHFNHLHRYLPALFLRAGGQVINVPVGHRPRTRGQSKYGNMGRLKVGITDLFGVAWLIRRPCLPELDDDI